MKGEAACSKQQAASKAQLTTTIAIAIMYTVYITGLKSAVFIRDIRGLGIYGPISYTRAHLDSQIVTIYYEYPQGEFKSCKCNEENFHALDQKHISASCEPDCSRAFFFLWCGGCSNNFNKETRVRTTPSPASPLYTHMSCIHCTQLGFAASVSIAHHSTAVALRRENQLFKVLKNYFIYTSTG
uniref:Uncharacterized protein n=1 Tax=Glossina brevipalpis TaxID=37001 RepID=A0A1A9W7X7_9MUSC